MRQADAWPCILKLKFTVVFVLERYWFQTHYVPFAASSRWYSKLIVSPLKSMLADGNNIITINHGSTTFSLSHGNNSCISHKWISLPNVVTFTLALQNCSFEWIPRRG